MMKMSVVNPAFSNRPGIRIEDGSHDLICKLQDIAKRIPQLKKTGDNFSLWERQLKVMLRNLTGTSDYFQQELHKHDPKLNQAVFSLIFWSVDEELQQNFIIDGSAGDAFRFLADRFQPASLAQCIINRSDFPEEILDNIANIVYHQSFAEHEDIQEGKQERISRSPKPGLKFEVYLGHHGPPVLTTIQNLAVVNRKFHRICLPKLWQKISFPTSSPAPMSLWTDDLLLKYTNCVKSVKFELEDMRHKEIDRFSERERGLYDNTSLFNGKHFRYGIGILNITKIFKVCPSIESVSVHLPDSGNALEWFSSLIVRLKSPFQLLPRLLHLTIRDPIRRGFSGDFIIDIIKKLPFLISLDVAGFHFNQKQSEEESFGWNLAQLQKLRKLSLDSIMCEDQTWSLESWPEQLTNLRLEYCLGLTLGMAHKLLSGNTPFLTKLDIRLEDFEEIPDLDVVRFDLPALKTLRIFNAENIDLLVCFENCKSIEGLEYRGLLFNVAWDSMKNHLSRRTWPKLLVLDVRNTGLYLDGKPTAKEKMKEISKPFGIKVLIEKD